MRNCDSLVIGGGIAGLSLAARLARHGKVVVLEGESAPGYHASGRSVAYAHFGLGERVVRTLTALSLPDLAAAGMGGKAAVARVHPALHIARADESEALETLEEVHRHFGCDYSRITGDEARAMVPVLKSGPEHCHAALVDHSALKLDTDAMLQGYLQELRHAGGAVVCGNRVTAIMRSGSEWIVEASGRSWRAACVVNAAGAWADQIAGLAGLARVGIEPRRRTVIAFAAPAKFDVRDWPFIKTVGEGFYMLPEGSGQLLASSMDQTPSEPCDAAGEELDIATAAHRIENACNIELRRINHHWAGLRSFAPDELPVVGHAAGAPGFFWYAGQGGYGFQTAPALARIGEALALGLPWPDDLAAHDLRPEIFSPARFSA